MKTKNIIMSVVFLGIVSTGVYAVTADKSSQQSNLTKKNQEIHLYTSASTSSKVIQDYPLTKSFVVIYQDPKNKDWFKVGDQKNGQVGWISNTQYNQAVSNYQKSLYNEDHFKTQSVYITETRTKDNKPKMNIEVYQNGKKLSDKEAQKVYKNIKINEQKSSREFMQEQKAINYQVHLMNQQMDELDNHNMMFN